MDINVDPKIGEIWCHPMSWSTPPNKFYNRFIIENLIEVEIIGFNGTKQFDDQHVEMIQVRALPGQIKHPTTDKWETEGWETTRANLYKSKRQLRENKINEILK